MSSAAERFFAEFGGGWDYKAALKAATTSSSGSAAAKAAATLSFRLEDIAQSEATADVAANPMSPDQDEDLKAQKALEDEIALNQMLNEDDTEGSESDEPVTQQQQAASSVPGKSQAAASTLPESQAALLPPWRQALPESQAAAAVPAEEAEAKAKARALALYKAAQQEISHGASGSDEDKKAYDAVEHILAHENHVRWQDRGPRGENAPEVWRNQKWRNQLHSTTGGTGRYGSRGGDPAKNAYFAEQAKKRKAAEQQNSKSGKGASGSRGSGAHQGNQGKGKNMEKSKQAKVMDKGKGD